MTPDEKKEKARLDEERKRYLERFRRNLEISNGNLDISEREFRRNLRTRPTKTDK